jgi:peroxiredoxin
VYGASFDTSADNKVIRAPDHQYANFPERFSYLIDPTGNIAKAYNVTDIAGHASEVLADLAALK